MKSIWRWAARQEAGVQLALFLAFTLAGCLIGAVINSCVSTEPRAFTVGFIKGAIIMGIIDLLILLRNNEHAE
jgi:uncharacterized transporter YbjL